MFIYSQQHNLLAYVIKALHLNAQFLVLFTIVIVTIKKKASFSPDACTKGDCFSMADIVSIGELIIDFTEIPCESGICYKQNAGGAPANLACMAAKLGASAAFIGKVGRDMFGDFLREELERHGVVTDGLITDKEHSTALAFVRNSEEGERQFMFYRKNGADLNLAYSDVKLKLVDSCRIFHFGALSLTAEPLRSATMNAVEYAKSKGKIISYDPNWRPHLWNSKEEAVQSMRSALRFADIVKVSEKELQIVSDCGNMLPGIARLFEMGVSIVCITQGAKGCIIASRKCIENCPAFKVETVDTLGSGDSFFGAFLYKLLEKTKDITELTGDELREMATFANACGALASTKKGAVSAMPDLKTVTEFMENYKEEII